jgi:hypothetical protein
MQLIILFCQLPSDVETYFDFFLPVLNMYTIKVCQVSKTQMHSTKRETFIENTHIFLNSDNWKIVFRLFRTYAKLFKQIRLN